MRIISINREFGSGGRELGRRLAQNLGFDYYDKEIITKLAQDNGLDPCFVEQNLKLGAWKTIPIVCGNSFSAMPSIMSMSSELLTRQANMIRDIAQLGRDCVIVGSSADTILKDFRPLKIFIYADLESKLSRCMAHRRPSEELSEQQMIRKIRSIDSSRIRTKEILSGLKWGAKDNYHLMVNSSGRKISELIHPIVEFSKSYFSTSQALELHNDN